MKNATSSTAHIEQSNPNDISTALGCTPPDADLTTTQNSKSNTSANTTWREKLGIFYRNRFKTVSISLQILVVWSVFEILLCFTVLCAKSANHPDNFMNAICSNDECPHFLETALYGRMIMSTVSIIGILMEMSTLTVLWFFMNAVGIFPLLPVIYSCFNTYADLNKTYATASSFLRFLRNVYNALLPPRI